MSELDLLLARYAAGGRLSDAEQAALRAALEKDPALRRSLLDDLQMDGALRGEAGGGLDGELFAQGVLDCLRAKRDETRFLERVQRRVSVTRRARPRRGSPAVWIAAAAAVALVALLFALASSRPSSTPDRPPLTKARRSFVNEPTPVPEPTSPAPAPKAPGVTEEDLRRRAEEAFTPKPAPVPLTKVGGDSVNRPEGPRALEPPKPVEEAPAAPTEAAIAAIAGTGAPVPPGRPLEGPLGVEFPDGTRVDLAAGARLSSITDAAGKDGLGRLLELERGELRAVVAKQPKGRAFAVRTPHGEARVVGTAFTLVVGPEGTRLEVAEGAVRLGGIDVLAGQFAVAGPGRKVAAKFLRMSALEEALERDGRVVINFGPPADDLPKGALNDAAEPFDAARGYGWTTAGARVVRRTGTSLDVLRATHVYGGTRDVAEVWKAVLPVGVYRLTIVVGDDREQGPHHVRVMGQVVINAALTGREQFVEVKDLPVAVRQGELTVAIGGHGTSRKVRASTGAVSDDTTLCYLVLTREK